MALFTNFATLSYNGGTTNSNTVTGEILETVTASKTAVTQEYTAGDTLSYVLSLVNSGDAVSGLRVSDDLGAYPFGAQTVVPLSYTDGSLRYYLNGVLQPAPAVTPGAPLVITGIEIPAGGNATLVYEVSVTEYAPLAPDSEITNTATITGGGISSPVIASATVSTTDRAELAVSKAVFPSVVSAGGRLSYSFEITNSGNTEATAADAVVLSDTFDPILSGLEVTLNNTRWAVGTNYNYDETSGAFSTLPGKITVPAASYTQSDDGRWTVEPGSITLVISGNIQTGI